MIKDQLSALLAKAMRDKDKVRLEVIRAIKSEFTAFETQKNASVLDDAAEIQIIRKMMQRREDTAKQYETAGRMDLFASEMEEATILKEFLPVAPSKEDIEIWLEDNNYHSIQKKEMGSVIKEVKSKFPSADGKVVAEIVKGLVV